MKNHRSRRKEAVLLCLPLLAVGGALFFVSRRADTRARQQAAFLALPFAPRFEVTRAPVSGKPGPRAFEVRARPSSPVGNGHSLWWMHLRLLDVRGKAREVWNSEWSVRSGDLQCLQSGGSLFFQFRDADAQGPRVKRLGEHFWRFERSGDSASDLLLVADAVAVPLPDFDQSISKSTQVSLVSPAELSAALRRPRARKFHVRLRLRARDDARWQQRPPTKPVST